MSESPLVSVITPCYNHGKYIRDAFESVVRQTYGNLEYFIIDDGSTDNSPEIIEELKGKYSNSRKIDFEIQKNMGLAFTMNKLIAKCKGKYIALVESDDVWTLDKIERQVVFLESHPQYGVCGGVAICINENNEVLPPSHQTIQKYTVYNLEDIMSFDFQIWPLTVIMRKEIFDEVGKYDESLLYIDAYTWIKIAVNNHPIVILPYHFGYYRMHESNVHWNTLKMYETLMKTADKFQDHPQYSVLRQNMLRYIFPYLTIKDKKEAISILPKAFKFEWRTIKGLIALLVPFSVIKFHTKTRYR